MCGIFCLTPQNSRTINMAPFLAWEMEDRGKDSWGVTNGIEIHKELGPITDNFKLFSHWNNVLYHTRQASIGTVVLENSHPFIATGDKGRVIGVHNGIISNHEELNKNNHRSCNVDSQHIFMHLAEGKELKELRAWGVAVWFINNQEEIHFLKFTEAADWYVGELTNYPGEFVMCSTRLPIERAAKMSGLGNVGYYKIKIGYEYIIKNGKILEGQEIYKSHPLANYINTFSHINVGVHNNSWEPCVECHHQYVDVTMNLVCPNCFTVLTEVSGTIPPTIWSKNGPTQKVRI